MSHLFGGYFDNEFSKNYSIKRGSGLEENTKQITDIFDEFNKTEINFDNVNYTEESNKTENDDNKVLDESILIQESIIIQEPLILDDSIIVNEKSIELNESILLKESEPVQNPKKVGLGKVKKYSDGLNPYRSNFISSIIAKKISLI